MHMGKFLIAAAATALVASPALAHPKLVSATPGPNATVSPPAKVQLNFSERLLPKFSGADVTMTGMPGMASHPPMKVTATVKIAADGKTMVVAFAKPLAKGTYRLDWHVVSSDTHRVKGGYAFKVA